MKKPQTALKRIHDGAAPHAGKVLLYSAFVGGLLLIALGAWQVAPALGLAVAGAELVAVALAYVRGAEPS